VELDNTYKALEEYSDRVVERARKNLNTTGFAHKGRKINASKELSKGLGYKIAKNNKGLIAEFTSKKDYAPFVEEGRKKGKPPPYRTILKWIEEKRLKLRNKKGQFITSKGQTNMVSAAIAIAKSIGKRGTKATHFFGDAMEYEFKQLPPEIGEALVKDMESVIVDAFQKNDNIKVMIK